MRIPKYTLDDRISRLPASKRAVFRKLLRVLTEAPAQDNEIIIPDGMSKFEASIRAHNRAITQGIAGLLKEAEKDPFSRLIELWMPLLAYHQKHLGKPYSVQRIKSRLSLSGPVPDIVWLIRAEDAARAFDVSRREFFYEKKKGFPRFKLHEERPVNSQGKKTERSVFYNAAEVFDKALKYLQSKH